MPPEIEHDHRPVWGLSVAFLLLTALAWSLAASAQESPELDALFQDNPLNLGILEVREDRWTYDQEVFLRMVRQAFEQPESTLEEDRDKWVCWLQYGRNEHGQRRQFLTCARNGDILARSSEFSKDGIEGNPLLKAGYGTYLRSTERVRRHELEELLNTLRGDDAFNDEFLALVRAGQRPPRKIPSDAELAQFAAASLELVEVGVSEPDAVTRAEIIKRHGLSVARFDHIGETVAAYATVRGRLAAAVQDASST